MAEKALSPRITTVLFIIYEMFEKERVEGVPSIFKSFFDTLPKSFSTLTDLSEDEMRELQCPGATKPGDCPLLRSALNRRSLLRKYTKDILDKFGPILIDSGNFSPDTLTFKNFTMVLNIVNSRAFQVDRTSEENKHAPILLPFADMINHHNIATGTNYRYNGNIDCFEIYADQKYLSGEEVFISYGQNNIQKLLRIYGFVLPDNIITHIHLAIPLEENEKNRTDIVEYVTKNPNATVTNLTLPGFLDSEFINLMKLKSCRAPCPPVDSEAFSRDPWLAWKVSNELMKVIGQLIQKLPTTLFEDIKILRSWKEKDLSQNMITVIMFRLQIKRVLYMTFYRLLNRNRNAIMVSAEQHQGASARPHIEWREWRNDMQLWDQYYWYNRNRIEKMWNPHMDLAGEYRSFYGHTKNSMRYGTSW
eukprot:CAMPEP_0167748460 /NCGR_PEP_ID=MMETSP0110_2-20121227/4850_1 /TAXON_ID=629695 /ORGANISM="Gymnochlora sp., Strain CCMP2014" /LENGTH=418 /DNA_ID=CAMNT_0007633477 /DNA_START=312 /DNA_END=1568 /DNA_ORIENTATION=+